MKLACGVVSVTFALAACGSDEAKKQDASISHDAPKQIDAKTIDAAVIDAPPPADAPPDAAQHVFEVTCPSGTVPTVGTGVMTYAPSALTINAGDVVKFVMAPTHDVAPDGGSDPGLVVGFNETKCLRFMETGTFGFHCSIHFFSGTITVQ